MILRFQEGVETEAGRKARKKAEKAAANAGKAEGETSSKKKRNWNRCMPSRWALLLVLVLVLSNSLCSLPLVHV